MFSNIRNNYAKRTLALFALIMCLVSLLFTTKVYADVTFYCPYCGTNHTVESGFQKFVIEACNKIDNNDIIGKKGDSESTGIDIEDVMKFDTTNNAVFSALWYGGSGNSGVKSLFDALVPIGLVLAVVFWFIELGEKVTTAQFNAEQLALMFVRLALGLIVVSMGFEIITLINKIGSRILDLVSSSMDAVTNICSYEEVIKANMIENVGKILIRFPSTLVLYLCKLIAYIIVWKRTLEIVVYAIFFPIGIADSVKGGIQSSSVRYMKRMLAKFVQGAVMYGMFLAFNLVKSFALTAGTFAGAFGSILLSLTLVTLLFQSESISNTIVGC